MSLLFDAIPAPDVAQTPWEIETFASLVAAREPKRILEIGTWHGGTLWLWMQLASELVFCVDDALRNEGLWREWEQQPGFSELRLIRGDSRTPGVIDQARDSGPYDMVFIDADHTYDAVRQDWENYGALCRDGGIVAFHDIVSRPDYGVERLWNELRDTPGTRAIEIVQTWKNNRDWGGIGVICK